MTKAWMLRQDGSVFPLIHHLYVMNDEDLSSEAEVAAFLISSKSRDIDLAEYVIDAWIALMIENSVNYNDSEIEIESHILEELKKLPYRFLYPLSDEDYINIHKKLDNYSDTGSLYDFIDDVRLKINQISEDIKHSLNQQFCRVRYGGQYNSVSDNNTIWFRISSVGYNWADTIYIFASNMLRQLNIDKITICRDYESDNGDVAGKPEYFYKAKDGSVYYDMPIDEFLQEEHEHSLVFSSTDLNSGVLSTIQSELYKGCTLHEILCNLSKSGITYRKPVWNYLVRKETSKCIESSQYFDNLPNVTKNKLSKLKRMILNQYPEIESIDIDSKPRENRAGNPVGFEMIFELESQYESIDHLQVSVVFSKSLGDVLATSIFRSFRKEYDDYIKFANIQFK